MSLKNLFGKEPILMNKREKFMAVVGTIPDSTILLNLVLMSLCNIVHQQAKKLVILELQAKERVVKTPEGLWTLFNLMNYLMIRMMRKQCQLKI